MSRVSIVVVLAITLTLAKQANAATCAAVSPDNADPPANSVEYAKWEASGFRRWDCKGGAVVDPKQILGKANFTSTDGAWTGGFTYIDKVARFDQTNTKEGESYSFDLDATPGLTNVTGALANARWTVNWIGEQPADLVKGEQYLVRTNTVGGMTPTKCPSTKSNWIEVPFTATYVLYNCADGATPASSAVSVSTIGAMATAVAAAAAALF